MVQKVSRIVVIVGPTAVGKTAVGVLVARWFDGEIISADSRQIYRGMEIGTGAPSQLELDQIRHHLVSVIDPDQRLSAGEFARMARTAVDDVNRRGKTPIIVGGSGLYIRALIDGLSPIPQSDPEIRRRVEEEIEQRGMSEMNAELARVDPEYAVKVDIHDRKRLVRALEVWRKTGRSFTDWHSREPNRWCQPIFFGLSRPRDELHRIIEERVGQMLEFGWLDELQELIDRYGLEGLPLSVTEAIGYRNLLTYIGGETDVKKDVVERIIIATRQFAKRQMTWFRADPRIQWREESGSDAVQKWAEWIGGIVKVI
ncbi:MAG: tRNA (adenosine(37)-N6)-dimethylallyltransferase MiaA [Candidatus Electryoneaceae bacterium]|nr:tRNA (adenosine(37)-N6)-dimethylallyltransferase MiaA [Candidatus Electryoneaceae bacterium]